MKVHVRALINDIYHQILNDQRHNKIVLLDYREVSEREFGEWSMGYIPEIAMTAPVNLKYSSNKSFDPYNMSGPSAHKFLVHLSKIVNVV
ncbi:BLUF domain-containing protein [Vibrio orientalis]|uniref:BLUF domain-containing protein n=1 Tax=Vibrio orientalis TaxID=28175 RepID=UPI00399D68BF